MRRLLAAAAIAVALAGATRAEDLYFPLDAFGPDVLDTLPLGELSYAGSSGTLTIVVPASMGDIEETTQPELEEGLIACINGKAMFRENGRRRFLSADASVAYCSG